MVLIKGNSDSSDSKEKLDKTFYKLIRLFVVFSKFSSHDPSGILNLRSKLSEVSKKKRVNY